MRAKYIIATVIALFFYAAAAFYVGWHLLETINSTSNTVAFSVYLVAYSALSVAYIAGRAGQFFFPGPISNGLIQVGAYWLGLFLYLLLGWGLLDLILYAIIHLGFLQTRDLALLYGNWIVIIAALMTFIWGIRNARNFQIAQYTIHIDKPCELSDLHMVAVSDTHLGLLVGKGRLEELISRIVCLQPDIVLLPGDILDENVGTFLDEGMDQCFQRLHPPLGLFACLGSHEYILGNPEKALAAMARAGITVLKDETVMVANSIYIAGRDDFYKMNLTNHPRKSLQEILKECDRSHPIILLDHYPDKLAEGQHNGVDLQLSGHTHRGQLFPFNLITHFKFELDAGYRKQGNFHVIVSSGFGTWLLPLRVGTTPEIVDVRITFKPKDQGVLL